MAIPRHPGDDNTPVNDRAASWRTKALIALAVAIVAVVLVLHLTGVIGGH